MDCWRCVAILVVAGALVPGAASARPGATLPVPRLVQTAEIQDGWALCWQLGAASPFWCQAYPRTAPAAVRLGWWGVVKCAVAIAAFIAGNVVAAYKIKKLGGIWKVARRILKAKGEERARAIAAIFGDLTGLTGVIDACGG